MAYSEAEFWAKCTYCWACHLSCICSRSYGCAVCSAIGMIWSSRSVCLSVCCLSVTKCIVATSYSKSVWRNKYVFPPKSTILQLVTHSPTTSLQTPHLLNHRYWCHLANRLKHTVSKRTTKISTPGIAIYIGLLHGYSRSTTLHDRLFLSNSWTTCLV